MLNALFFVQLWEPFKAVSLLKSRSMFALQEERKEEEARILREVVENSIDIR